MVFFFHFNSMPEFEHSDSSHLWFEFYCLVNSELTYKRKTKFKRLFQIYSIPTQRHLLTPLGYKPFENIVGKEENAGNQHFLLFPQCFLLHHRYKYHFCCLICHLHMLSIWSRPKFCRLGMG